MSATSDSTFTDPEQRITDLERQLAERTAERDEALDGRPRPLRYYRSSTAHRAISPRCSTPYWRRRIRSAEPSSEACFFTTTIASHDVPEALASRLREGIGANDSRSIQQPDCRSAFRPYP